MIVGWSKNLGVPPEHVIYDISYENLLLYSAATPLYDDEKEDWDDSLDANNPNNYFEDGIVR